MKSKKSPLILKPGKLPFPMRPGPMFSRVEAANVTYTVSGDRIHIQAPREIITKIAERLSLLGAKSDAASPYGPSCERSEGKPR
jgi:hypothetical protein